MKRLEIKCVLSLVTALLGWLLCSGQFAFFFQSDPVLLHEVRNDVRVYEDLKTWPLSDGKFENDGFKQCASGAYTDSGWCLAPGTKGVLRFVLPDIPDTKSILLRLFFFSKSPNASNRLAIYREGEREPRLEFNNIYFANARLDLTSVLEGPGGRVILSFEGDNSTDKDDVTLQSLEVRFFDRLLPSPPSVPLILLAMLVLGFVFVPWFSWKMFLPLWIVLMIGFALRFSMLSSMLYFPLEVDAAEFRLLATKMVLFSETGFYSAQFGPREPFFLIVVKGVLSLFGNSETHVRFVSLFASMVSIGLMYRIGNKLFGRTLGLLSALCCAISLPLVMEATRGLRLEVEICLVLLFVDVVFLSRFRLMWIQASLAGAIVGLLALTRFSYIVTMPLLVVFAFVIKKPRNIQAAILAILVMVALQIPHRVSGYRVNGNVFWDMGKYAQWHTDYESAGKPGGPTKMEMWQTIGKSTATPSYGEYLFLKHTPMELLRGTARGFWKALNHMNIVGFPRELARRIGLNLGFLDTIFLWVGVLGLIFALCVTQYQWIPIAVFVFLAPIAFQYDLGVLERWRQVSQVFPFFVLGVMLSLSLLVSFIKRRINAQIQ